MMIRRVIPSALTSGFILMLLLANASEVLAQSPMGIWLDHSGRGAIQISSCGDRLCGYLVWVQESENAEGCGVQIIGEARKISSDLWDDGWIYSPEKNRKYNVEIKPLPNGTLRVKGYAGSKMFSRTMIWKPAPPDLELCQNMSKNENKAAKQESSTPPSNEKFSKADPLNPSEEMRATENPPNSETKSSSSVRSEEAKGSEKRAALSPERSQNVSPKESARSNSSSSQKTIPSFGNSTSQEKKITSLQSSFSTGSVKEKLDQLQKETGYGVKKIGNGSCRLKVPFVTIRIRCDD